MKLYEFKIAVWCGFFVMGYLSLFIYLLIWLNNGFQVQDMILESKLNILNQTDERTASIVKSIVMKSAIKGEYGQK